MAKDPTLPADLAGVVFSATGVRGRGSQLPSGEAIRFDQFAFQARPALLTRVADALVSLLPDRTEVIAGIELGGVGLATAMSLRTGLPMAVVRHTEHPSGGVVVEGFEVDDAQVVVVDALVDTGTPIERAARGLRALGADVRAALCVVDMQQGARGLLVRSEVELTPLFGVSQLPLPRSQRTLTSIRGWLSRT